jgi:tetratricopeptide (TPR) repeat protein
MQIRMRLRQYVMLALILVLASLLVACNDQPPTPQPTALSATAQPTVAPQPTPATTVTVLSLDPTAIPVAAGDPSAEFAAGVDAYNKGDYDSAIVAFNKAIESRPDFEAAYVNGGLAYFAKGDNENAHAYMAAALSLDPQDAFATWCYGLNLYHAGASDNALEAFNYLVELAPKDPTGYFWRANVYLKQEFVDDASIDFEEVVALSPDSDMGKQAAAALEQLNNGETPTPAQAPLPAMKEGKAPPIAGPTEVPSNPETLVADLGFRPQKDGFQFQNWGPAPDRVDMTAEDMRRMFGDQVCANTVNGCNLTASAEQWMAQINEIIKGGHCEGFAALSLILYKHQQEASQFGAASTHDLTIDGNAALQRELAYYWTTQFTSPTRSSRVLKTPSEILDVLISTFKDGQNAAETYTIEFFQPGFKAGHAVTPYAVEDRGNGQFAIRIYDNNLPDMERAILVDRNANSWSYKASTNPDEQADEYRGDASTGTLMLTPTSPRLGKQACPFCENAGGGTVGGALAAPDAQAETQYNELWLDGEAHLLITDKDGKRTGFDNGQFVNEIPGVDFLPITSANLWEDDPEPIYFVPTGIDFTLTVQSSEVETSTLSTVTMIGPGYVLSVQDIVLDPGQKDTITFSPDGKTVTYKTDYNESPDILLGTNIGDADYTFLVKGTDIESGASITINLDTEQGWLAVDTLNNKEVGTYGLVMDRTDATSEQIFGHGGIELQPNDVAYLLYGEWKGNDTPLPVGIDHNNDGTLDETVDLVDAR